MADHFYSCGTADQFDPIGSVTVGTSTSGEAIELRVHDGSSLTAVQVLKALKSIEGYFSRNNPTIA